jgi:hypothetical protein
LVKERKKIEEKLDSGDLRATTNVACKSKKSLGDFKANIDSGDLKKKR